MALVLPLRRARLGLFVTYDGGSSWKRFTEQDGMPAGLLGRIGLAIAPSNPNIVYALVEAEKSAMLRSDDGGKSWKTVNQENDVAPRPFYFADIAVDPEFPNRVYSLWSLVSVSDDGGKSFQVLVPFRKAHPDHHAIWIDPNDGREIIEGNDGGVNFSHDRGNTWRFVSNLPLAQYYHIATDDAVPYNVYGGMQDNGSWRGPSSIWLNGGIRNMYWDEVGFGDGFGTIPIDPDHGYSMSQEGYLMRWDNTTGRRKDIRPAGPEGVKLRFNWNAGMAKDPFNPHGVYFGSQFLHYSPDEGETWTIISPDLTTNNPDWQHQDKSGGLTPDVTGAENYTTVIAIAPSPLDRNVVWAGTDDGRLQVTRDGGKSWSSVETNVPGVPKNTWIPHVEASRFEAGSAYVVFDNHRRSDWTPYVYRTTDYGKTWSSLATKNLRGYPLTIVQDPGERNLLFLGTEFGLWFSNDGGKSWTQWTAGFPTVSTMALAIQERENDLVIGTHGRAAWVIDDITPLRTVSDAILAEPLHLFPIPRATEHEVKQAGASRFPGDNEFRGENRDYGAMITFSVSGDDLPWAKEERERVRKEKELAAKLKPLDITSTGVPQEVEQLPKGPASQKASMESGVGKKVPEQEPEKGPQAEIRITDENGTVIRTFKRPVTRGINRVFWSLRRDGFDEPPRSNEEEYFSDENEGPEVLPGIYTVTVKFGDAEQSQQMKVFADPRYQIPMSAMQAKWDAEMHLGRLQEVATAGIKRIAGIRGDVEAITGKVKSAEEAKKKETSAELPAKSEPNPLLKAAGELTKRLDEVETLFWTPPKTKGIVAEDNAMSKIGFMQFSLGSSWDAPTDAQMRYMKEAETRLQKAVDALNQFEAGDLAKFREEVVQSDVGLLPTLEPLKIGAPPAQ